MQTHQTIHDILQDQWENDLPEKVLQALRPLDGKMVTTRLLDKLPGGKEQWRLRREYGMTHIENNDYWRTNGYARNGVSLLVAHRTDSFPLDVNKLEADNPAYFSGRRERNHKRMEAMNTKNLLDKMAAVMNKAQAAWNALEQAKAEFEALAGYGEPFSPDRYDLEKMCGLFETRDSGNRTATIPPHQPKH